MLPLSKWENQDKSHSSGRELLSLPQVQRFRKPSRQPSPPSYSFNSLSATYGPQERNV